MPQRISHFIFVLLCHSRAFSSSILFFYSLVMQALSITAISQAHRRIYRQCRNKNRCRVAEDPGIINKATPTYTINTTPRHKTPTILAPIPKTPTQALSQHVTHHPATQHQQYPQQTHIVASTTSPRSIYSNKSYSRMPNQFRPLVQHRTINTATQQTMLLTRQSPHHIG